MYPNGFKYIKNYDLKDVVRLINVTYKTQRGIYSCAAAIASDGVTHLLSKNLED